MSVVALTAISGGRLTGYASLFGVVDLSGDKVEPGAFFKSIARRGADGVRMLWQHDPKEPIGRWTRIAEDRRGLLVEGELALSTQRGRDVHELLKARAVDGLSIGFRATRSTRSPGGVRRLTEIDLWEISVVTFPMQPQARIALASVVSAPLRLAERLRAAALTLSTRPFRPDDKETLHADQSGDCSRDQGRDARDQQRFRRVHAGFRRLSRSQ